MRLLAKGAVALTAIAVLAGCSAGSGAGASVKTQLNWWVINPSSPTAAKAQDKII
jgi:raffinose/stachyose/melibiose transport system substrate-binding protein